MAGILTTEQIQKNTTTYLTLLNEIQFDLTPLVQYLVSIDYFNAPATTTEYRAYQGGLCEHALLVYNELTKLAELYYPGKYSKEDLVKVALFKDIYKAVLYEQYNRNVKNAEGKWESVKSYKYRENRYAYGDLGFSSFMIIKNYIGLSDEVIEAICNWSLGRESNYFNKDFYKVARQFPLVTLTNMADNIANFIAE